MEGIFILPPSEDLRGPWRGEKGKKRKEKDTLLHCAVMEPPPSLSLLSTPRTCDLNLCGEPSSLPSLCASGHTFCEVCAIYSFSTLAEELSLQNGGLSLASRYYASPPPGLAPAALPGLLCPCCLPSEDARASYARAFWGAVSAGVDAAAPPTAGRCAPGCTAR